MKSITIYTNLFSYILSFISLEELAILYKYFKKECIESLRYMKSITCNYCFAQEISNLHSMDNISHILLWESPRTLQSLPRHLKMLKVKTELIPKISAECLQIEEESLSNPLNKEQIDSCNYVLIHRKISSLTQNNLKNKFVVANVINMEGIYNPSIVNQYMDKSNIISICKLSTYGDTNYATYTSVDMKKLPEFINLGFLTEKEDYENIIQKSHLMKYVINHSDKAILKFPKYDLIFENKILSSITNIKMKYSTTNIKNLMYRHSGNINYVNYRQSNIFDYENGILTINKKFRKLVNVLHTHQLMKCNNKFYKIPMC